RNMRIVAFSTACVYPFVPVDGPGADERTPATPPSGDYANSCVGRERMFEYGSRKHGTAGRLVRLSYAIDMRYGVLHDVATAVFNGAPLDLTMGHADVIWQGDANEQSLRLLAHCTTPTSPINITGPEHTSIRWLAVEFGRRFGRTPVLVGDEAPTAWLEDTTEAQRLFGKPRVPIGTMIAWIADWIARRQPSLGKPTHSSTRDGKSGKARRAPGQAGEVRTGREPRRRGTERVGRRSADRAARCRPPGRRTRVVGVGVVEPGRSRLAADAH